jgi:hypothetical protein
MPSRSVLFLDWCMRSKFLELIDGSGKWTRCLNKLLVIGDATHGWIRLSLASISSDLIDR